MAKNSTVSAPPLLLILATAAAIFAAANAQSTPAPAPGPGPAPLDCFPYLLNLSDCLSYVQQGSNLTKPDKPCCPEVKTLLETQPICLCQLLAHPDQSPLPLDLPRAVGLTSVCKLQLPFGTPVSGCAALGVPIVAPAPASAPTPAAGSAITSPAAPSSGTTLSPDGLPSTPASPSNDGPSIAGSRRHFLVGLAVVVFASFF